MIARIQALNYRSLRYVDQPLGPFHVLIGPNASGKSTFLDVVAFLGRLVTDGVEAAVRERTEDFRDLVWKQQGDRFELAIEAVLPEGVRRKLKSVPNDVIRYEVAVGLALPSDSDDPVVEGELGVLHERAFLKPATDTPSGTRDMFPGIVEPTKCIVHKSKAGWRTVVSKNYGANDNFTPETKAGRKGWVSVFRFGHRKTALGNVPPDEALFPAANWLRSLLTDGVQPFVLNSAAIRRPSPPNQRRGFRTDGSNLPWVVRMLGEASPKRFQNWVSHVRTALPDLADVKARLRNEDRHMYAVIEYSNGLQVPSWMASDGTLRLLALTLPAYLPDFQGVYLIEEPENGVHPQAVETVYQSLSSVYDAQILVASHSPVLLALASPGHLLCFARASDGATDVVSGERHPMLGEWKREANLGQLFAAGVLG